MSKLEIYLYRTSKPQFDGGAIYKHYYSPSKTLLDDLISTEYVDKNLLELNKNKFDNIRDLIEAVLKIQEYQEELKHIGIEL